MTAVLYKQICSMIGPLRNRPDLSFSEKIQEVVYLLERNYPKISISDSAKNTTKMLQYCDRFELQPLIERLNKTISNGCQPSKSISFNDDELEKLFIEICEL